MSLSEETPETSGSVEKTNKQKCSDKTMSYLSNSTKKDSANDMKTSPETVVEELQRDQQEETGDKSR